MQLIGRALGRANGPSRNSVDEDTLRVVTGVEGDFEGVGEGTMFESWEWELSAAFSQTPRQISAKRGSRPSARRSAQPFGAAEASDIFRA